MKLADQDAILAAAEAPPACSYCERTPKLVTGSVIYPRLPNLKNKPYWFCAACDAYVGCHEAGVGQGDGTRPLGTLANATLRRARLVAHEQFDAQWRSAGLTRTQAYKLLARQLSIPPHMAHIGMFDEAMCARVIAVCKAGFGKAPLNFLGRPSTD